MIVVLFIAVAGLVAGFLAGGSVRNFERVRVHWWGAAFTGLVLQAAPLGRWLDDDAVVVVLITSYALLVAFMWVNRRLPAAPLLMLGLALNMLVIGLNGGMPVSEGAIRTAGAPGGALSSGIDDGKHHLMRSSDVLTPLADVIGLPRPVATVLSVGDLFLYSGIVVFTVIVMRGRFAANRRPPAWIQMYRGKHLPRGRRLPRRSRPGTGPQLVAGSSGTSP
ncbi:MAG: DUF5317 family protein [Actinomycetota bacterium]